MERDILSQVIEAEKDIQQRLDLEKVKVREWIERATKECEEEFIREEIKIKESLAKSVEEAIKEGEINASGIVRRAEVVAERLRRLQADALTKVIAKQIDRILPG